MSPPSQRPGKGAVPYHGGVMFRTWAKFADGVYVRGDFNNWQLSHPLAPEGDGWWSCDVPYANPADRYRFHVRPAGDKIDPYATSITHLAGDGIIYQDDYAWQHPDFIMPPWHELVIYQLHLGSYPDRPAAPADLFAAAGAADELRHLEQLGVNAIELMPATGLEGERSWGYSGSQIFAVESAYGGPAALKRFVDTLHGRGIAVILAVDYSHLSATELSLWRYDGWGQLYPPLADGRGHGDADAQMGGIYFYNDWRAGTHRGHKNRPDYGRPEVREYLRDNALMWLDQYRIDGLRLATTQYMRNVHGSSHVLPEDPGNLGGWGWELLRWINSTVRKWQPWKLVIADDKPCNEYLTRPTAAGGAGFGSQWDSGFVHRLHEVLSQPLDCDRDLEKIKAAVECLPNGCATQRVISAEPYDRLAPDQAKRRLPDAIWPGNAEGWHAKKRTLLGAVLMFTSPGIPMIFQGQEVFEIQPFDLTAQKPAVDWNRFDRYQGIYTLYRDLVQLRRNWHDNTAGLRGPSVRVHHCYSDSKVMAFHRWDKGGPGDDVVIVLNFENRIHPNYHIGFPRPGEWKVRLNTDSRYYDVTFGDCGVTAVNVSPQGGMHDGYPYRGDLAIAPYSAMILSQDR